MRKMPSLRGWYLFLWGIVYLMLGGILHASTGKIVFPAIFAVAGGTALSSSWFHRLDPIAFGVLVTAAVFRATSILFVDMAPTFSTALMTFIMWTSIGATHFIVARWPGDHVEPGIEHRQEQARTDLDTDPETLRKVIREQIVREDKDSREDY